MKHFSTCRPRSTRAANTFLTGVCYDAPYLEEPANMDAALIALLKQIEKEKAAKIKEKFTKLREKTK